MSASDVELNAAGGEDPQVSAADKTNRWTRWEPRIDVALVTILAIASLAAAWCAYQANLWNGEQSSKYAQASARRIEAASASSLADRLTLIDITTFTNYVNAYAQGNTALADFYVARFRSAFQPAFNAWIATDPRTNPDAPSSPFVMPEYVLPEAQRAVQLEEEAGTLFDEGQDDNERGDNYVLATVILAISLFFAGIAPRIWWVPARLALMALAVLILVLAFFNIATFPIA